MVYDDSPHTSVIQIRIRAIALQVDILGQVEVDLDNVKWLPGDGIIGWLRVASGEGEEGQYGDECISHCGFWLLVFGYWLVCAGRKLTFRL